LIVLDRSSSESEAQQEYQNTLGGELERMRRKSGVLDRSCSVLLAVAVIVVVVAVHDE